MKKLVLFCSFILLLSNCASAPINDNEINQKLDSKSNKEIVLVKVIDDSRCPEGVQCIWAGEVTIEVAAYENGKLIEEVKFTINPTNNEEAKKWFAKHSSENKGEIKEISVLPYPKEGVAVKWEDYYIKLIY